MAAYRSIEDRLFFNSFLEVETGCWTWLGRTTKDGYGLINIRVDGKHTSPRAHRLAYETLTGAKIGEGMELDHKCYNRRCINPAHLEEVTPSENKDRRRY